MSTPGHKRITLPESFENVLLKYLKRHYLKRGGIKSIWNQKDTEYFSRGIIALNKNYTLNRAGKYRDYFSDPVMRSGYLSYFLPVNAMKAYSIFRRHDTLTHSKTIRICDVGAGPLTMSFGFLFHLIGLIGAIGPVGHIGPIVLIIDAFELNKKILFDGITLMKDFIKEAGLQDKIDVRVNAYTGNIFKQKLASKNYDYIFLGNFINEFDKRDVQIQIVQKLLRNFSKKGTKVIFLEPGSKKFTRDLQNLRDVMLEETPHVVIGPCLHQHKCPLNLTAKSDWCNFTKDWRAPRFIQNFDELTSLKKEYLLYSYLFLQNGIDVPQYKNQEFVAITDLIKGKGRFEIVGCGPAGRIRFIRSHRDKAKINDHFDYLSRGKNFVMPDYQHEGGFELNWNVAVKKRDRIIL